MLKKLSANVNAHRDLTNTNDLLKTLCIDGKLNKALNLLNVIQQNGGLPTTKQIFWILQGCTIKKDLIKGRQVYGLITKLHLESNAFLETHLIRMFDACNSLPEAHHVFNEISKPSLFSWSAIVSACARCGECELALGLHSQMLLEHVQLDKYVFIAVLKACLVSANLESGMTVHSHIIESGFELDLFVANLLIDMYLNHKSLLDAQELFHGLEDKDAAIWNNMIRGYTENGCGLNALNVFTRMQIECIEANLSSFINVLNAFSLLKLLREGMIIHAFTIHNRHVINVSLRNALIDMYAKCAKPEFSNHVFEKHSDRDVITWNAMIAGYAQNGCHKNACLLFDRMQAESIEPNIITWNTVLASQAQRGCFAEALQLFDLMQLKGLKPDIVTWNTLLSSLLHYGDYLAVVHLFNQMLEMGIPPTTVTLISALKAFTNIPDIYNGQKSHILIVQLGFEFDMIVGTTLIDMYANYGNLAHSKLVFDHLETHNVVTWTALIAAFNKYGHFKTALEFFRDMSQEQCEPNEITFVSILSACSHSGLLDEGYSYFELMRTVYGISPKIEHYNCLIELLGAAGYLSEAKHLLISMPFDSNIMGWTSLLSHCRKHKDVVIARECFERAMTLDSKHASFYIMMSNIYSDAGMFLESEHILKMKMSADGKVIREVTN